VVAKPVGVRRTTAAAGRSQLSDGCPRARGSPPPASRALARVAPRQQARADRRVAARAVKRSSARASIPLSNPPAAGRSQLPGGGPHTIRSSAPASHARTMPREPAKADCLLAARVLKRSSTRASIPLASPLAAGRSRLQGGGPCSVEFVRDSKHSAHHTPAAGQSRLPSGGSHSGKVYEHLAC
jgi:hypothetical protein